MRVRIDRAAEALRLDLSEVAEAQRVEVADGVAVAYDSAGRIVGVELRGVDPAALYAFTVELAGLTDRSTGTAMPRPAPKPAPPPPHEGPVSWEAEAEAAMLRMPFFNRGKVRLAAIALARRHGQDRVTVATLETLGR